MVGEWRGRDKTYFDYASLIDSDSFQVSCRFPDLLNMCQWIWELHDRLAIENYINKLEGSRKRKVPSDELIYRIHGL